MPIKDDEGRADSVSVMPNGGRAHLPPGFDVASEWISGNKGFIRHVLEGDDTSKVEEKVEPPKSERVSAETAGKKVTVTLP